MDIGNISSFEPLWIKLISYFGGFMYLFLLGMFQGVEILDYNIGICLVLIDSTKVIPSCWTNLHSQQ